MSRKSRGENVILFDGVCHLCNGIVRFVIRRDPHARFQFAPLQSEAAARYLRRQGGEEAGSRLESFLLIQDGQIYEKSSAALRVCKQLNGLWPLLYAFIIVPLPLRNFVYGIIAKNRYRWFGRREQCMMPTPDIRSRFLE